METLKSEQRKVLNGVDTSKFQETINAINEDPDLALYSFHIQNEWIEGARSKSTVVHMEGGEKDLTRKEPFVLDSDEPETILGQDKAPNPLMYLLHALASCLSTTIVYHASERGLKIDGLNIDIEGDVDLHGFLGLSSEVRPGFQDVRVNVSIESDEPKKQILDLIAFAQKVSPIIDTLRNRIPLEVNFKD